MFLPPRASEQGNVIGSVRIYSMRQYKVSVPLKKTLCPTVYQRLKKRNRLLFLRRLYAHNFYAPFSVKLRPKSIYRRAKVIDELERNWRGEKRLIDKKSINNQRTEAERSTRRAETIDGLKRNGRRNNRRTRAKLARREAINRREEQKQSTD